jgi:hypothetical protein
MATSAPSVPKVGSELQLRGKIALAHGVRMIMIGDARLPRDTTAAVADAARLLVGEELAAPKPPATRPMAQASNLEQP